MTQNAAVDTSSVRGPGRPRIADHDERILDAVATMVDEDQHITVSAVVEASGVSRAALYRRWSTMTELIATALDRGRASLQFDLTKNVKDALGDVIFAHIDRAVGREYTHKRFRKRIQLVMENPDLQEAYWQSHVHRRRKAMVEALATGIERGELRADLDVEAAIDAINGTFYYQMVARGSGLDDPATQRRCREAFDIVWRGMEA
ncbi:MAG: TetR/AcrR family transcriptional regulator [Yaniella sp.]|uniref:TetR/AcrR family transcriptional regulator n=1 Tax=Yaniella sp. TaxID=2773929 RepID=UPI003F9DD3FF